MEKINKSSLSGFNEKMIFSSAREDKKIFLWDENTGTVTYTFEDPNSKNYIENILILGQDLYSEYILTLQANKSLITIYKTNATEPFLKCNPIDERITHMETSDDSKYLYIATENGNFFIYELFSGNLVCSTLISAEKILVFKSFFKNNSAFLIVSEDYIKFYYLENILEKINLKNFYNEMEIDDGDLNTKGKNKGFISQGNSSFLDAIAAKEIPNIEKFSNVMIYGLPASHAFFYSKNKISAYIIPELKMIKSILAPPGEEIKNVEINPKDHNSFFVLTKSKVFFIRFEDFFNGINSRNMNNNADLNLKSSFPDPILDSEIPITSSTLTNKNILIGFDDGKIHVYSYANILNFSRNSPLKPNLIFSHHKGGIVNIVCGNRPISQYGLNFNNKIEEIIVKPLKKPSIPYSENIPIKISMNKENIFEKILYENCNEKTDYGLYMKSIEENEVNKGNEKTNGKDNPKINKINNTANLNDPKFLKKKLNEMTDILQKY